MASNGHCVTSEIETLAIIEESVEEEDGRQYADCAIHVQLHGHFGVAFLFLNFHSKQYGVKGTKGRGTSIGLQWSMSNKLD